MFIVDDFEEDRSFVIMPFIKGESLHLFLRRYPQLTLRYLKEMLRTPFEFHRRLALIMDYKAEHFIVDTENTAYPVRFFDYVDTVILLNTGFDDSNYSGQEVSILIDIVDSILRPLEDLMDVEDIAELNNRLKQLTKALSGLDAAEVERIYREVVFTFLDELIAKYDSAFYLTAGMQSRALRPVECSI